jgi:dTDP-4-amino-4,6-dideoxygalactose transaminase
MTTRAAGQLAIDGGVPVRSTFLPYAHQQISDDDVQQSWSASIHWLTTGPRVPRVEAALAEATGARCVAFSSGTAALHGAAIAAGLGPGDEAVTTPMTFAATANCVRYAGAEPRFADASRLAADRSGAGRVCDHAQTKAILPVDYAPPADYATSGDRRRGRGR